VLTPGKALVAPGDFHMLFEKHGTEVRVKLNQGAPENFCRPAVDPMFRSLATLYNPSKMLMAILTGMGSDGMRGADPLVNAGATLVAQDQPSSVVWGMPGAVATAGLCTAVLPLAEIGPWLRRKATGGAG
jgi:two-component system chemotaxis response regulator CheB